MIADNSRQDRLAIGVFLALVIALSLLIDVPMATAGSIFIWNGWGVFLLMWAPGLAGLATSLIVYRSIRPLGLLGNRSTLFWVLVAALIPVAYTFLIYPALQAAGLVSLSSQYTVLVLVMAASLQSLRNALGEELGWRGFAAPVFSRVFGFYKGQVLLGIVWFIYHVPPLLFTDYGASPHMIAGNIMFLVSVMALTFVLAFLRERSDSVWPSTFFHASHNLIFLHLYDPVTPVSDTGSLFIGEQGAALVGVQLTLAACVLVLHARSQRSSALSHGA